MMKTTLVNTAKNVNRRFDLLKKAEDQYSDIKAIEDFELKLHRARLGHLSFPSLAMECFDKGSMTNNDFLILNACVEAGDSLEHALTLNKMTILFNKVA